MILYLTIAAWFHIIEFMFHNCKFISQCGFISTKDISQYDIILYFNLYYTIMYLFIEVETFFYSLISCIYVLNIGTGSLDSHQISIFIL